jgi:hypothetical protein
MLEMEISMFDGVDVLCTDKYFTAKGTPETEKLPKVAIAFRGCAHHWWVWWHHCHPHARWESFVTAFLWRFKPEYRDILPIPDEEEEREMESKTLTVQGSFDVQQRTNQGEIFLITIGDDTERIQSENERSVAEPMEGGSNVIREISEIEGKMKVIDEEVEEEIEAEGSGREHLMETMHIIVTFHLCAKNTIQNKVYDPGISSHVSQIHTILQVMGPR